MMIPIIGLASGLGGSNSGSKDGPQAIRDKISINGTTWNTLIQDNTLTGSKLEQIATLNQKLAKASNSCSSNHPFTLFVHGDHSCAIGTWSGIACTLKARNEELAILWFDAHMDSHTLDSSDTGNIHGMPLASLLGYGDPALKDIGLSEAKVKPENLFIIGIRSYEEAERKFLEKLNVRVYFMEEVLERGLEPILQEIMEKISSKGLKYGISLDIDYFDPKEMCATGTPADRGASVKEFLDCYSIFQENPPVAFEFVEYNPNLDPEGTSLIKIKEILDCVVETTSLVETR